MIAHKGTERKTFTISASTQEFHFTDRMPLELLRKAYLRLVSSAFALGGGTNVTDGEKTVLRSITVGSRLHKLPFYNNMDGKSLYRMWQILYAQAAAQGASASAFSCLFDLPFGHMGNLRHPSKRINDLAIWATASKMYIDGILGVLTDLVAGGAPSGTANLDLLFQYQDNADPRPYDPRDVDPADPAKVISGDRPILQPEIFRDNFNVLSTSGDNEVPLKTGQGRRPLYILVFQRTSADAEVSDIFTADTTKVTLKYAKRYLIEPGTRLTDFDKIMEREMGIALPAGCHVFPIALDGKVADSFVTDPTQEFLLTFDNVATAASRQLAVVQFNGIPYNDEAEPAAQLAKAASVA